MAPGALYESSPKTMLFLVTIGLSWFVVAGLLLPPCGFISTVHHNDQGRGMMSEATSVHFELQDTHTSSFAKYKALTVGKRSNAYLIKYELITSLFGRLPGGIGYFLRQIFYDRLLKRHGKGTIWGRDITLRHPCKVSVGDGVIINDYALLDAYGDDDSGIQIENQALISRNSVLNSKGGQITVGKKTNIGMFCTVISRDCLVHIGDNVLMSAYCHLMGGGSHTMDRTDIPIAYQSAECLGIKVEDNVWLGSGVKVMDGCTIGRDSVIGTNSFVNSDIPPYSIAYGQPAKVIRTRKN